MMYFPFSSPRGSLPQGYPPSWEASPQGRLLPGEASLRGSLSQGKPPFTVLIRTSGPHPVTGSDSSLDGYVPPGASCRTRLALGTASWASGASPQGPTVPRGTHEPYKTRGRVGKTGTKYLSSLLFGVWRRVGCLFGTVLYLSVLTRSNKISCSERPSTTTRCGTTTTEPVAGVVELSVYDHKPRPVVRKRPRTKRTTLGIFENVLSWAIGEGDVLVHQTEEKEDT